MKPARLVFYIVTGLMAALMFSSAVPDVLQSPGALAIFNHLGYPQYLLTFLGAAKICGVAMVLLPGVRRIKEWAFAGLTIDLTGALYSHISVGDPPGVWMPALIGLVLVSGSYVAYRMKGTADEAIQRFDRFHEAPGAERRLGSNA